MFRSGTFFRRAALPEKLRAGVLLSLLSLLPLARGQTPSPPPSASPHPAATSHAAANPSVAQMAAALDRVTQANAELFDLLKKQQAVLEDIQFDRRLQNRQISSLEERLEDAMTENAQLQAKVAKLEEQIAVGMTPITATMPGAPASGAKNSAPTATLTPAPPTPPSTYLPPPENEGMPGTKSWHRLFTLSGSDSKSTGLFHIQGVQWRVLWHNQDQPGAAYANTSALFINAFPRDDTIPQKVCAKLGSGGDSTELAGPGNYYLKIEASGGKWELAVEDFR